ncbi:hypothetical protein [Desulfovibrio sp. 86]|uniref:Uncharacterized protein n=1 Tax=uncultured Desulfovibrio sp. TaxID=167968 RepID=A0A212L0B5_9BACT|nr:hypothetical protein [Desulfovibrio sp. 86]SCM70927.1 conserved hypothetical protein [uncultured Desulfovibrio sp.]VZH32597.1 conserved protein of unknown function [Desulfovibrio sp. 86]
MKDERKTFSTKKYQEEIKRLVHFTAKVVNSNATAAGVRLGPEDALDMPYVSLRTLLGSGLSFPLDYAEGGASKAGIVKHIRWVLADAPEAEGVGTEEKKAIVAGIAAANASGFRTGMEYVDHRLRQLLIPKKGAAGGYVSMTPMTAGSICPLFFDHEQGLVPLHNKTAREEPEGTRRKLRQARFGIGGSKPLNVGYLASHMQRPLMVSVPDASIPIRQAFALYYQGLSLDVHAPGPFREAVQRYAAFREEVLQAGSDESTVTLRERAREEELVAAIACAVLNMAVEAQKLLAQHEHLLPEDELLSHLYPPRYARVSSLVRPLEIRGLLDPSVRRLCDNWPRAMARLAVSRMLMPHKGTGQSLLKLDSSARFSLEAIMEEAFR